MYRILVPLDASPIALRAIPWADALAGALDSTVLIARSVAWHGAELPQHGETGDGLLESMTHAEQELEAAARKFHEVTPRTEVIRGEPEAIEALARDQQIDLVVMATHGRCGPERTLVGSISGEIVAGSGLPVLSIGPNVDNARVAVPKRIIAAFDGSPQSEMIFAPLVPLASGLGAAIVIFRALETIENLALQGALVPIANPFDPPTHALTRDMGSRAEALRRQGLPVEVAVRFGPAGVAILEAAATETADLIALTTHSRRGLARWMLGSVAEQVVAEAAMPVLVFHPPSTEAEKRTA